MKVSSQKVEHNFRAFKAKMVDAGNICKEQEKGASFYKALKYTVDQINDERVVKNLWDDAWGTTVR